MASKLGGPFIICCFVLFVKTTGLFEGDSLTERGGAVRTETKISELQLRRVQAVHMTVEAESRPSMAQPFLVLNLEVFDTEEAKRLPIAEMFVNVENQELSFTYPNVFLCAANLTSEKPEWQPDLIEIKTTYEDENKVLGRYKAGKGESHSENGRTTFVLEILDTLDEARSLCNL